MVSYDPQLWREAVSQSRGVQSAGRLMGPGVIVDEEESQFEIQPVQQPQFSLPQQQDSGVLGTIGRGAGRVFSELDRPITERLGFQLPEMRGPFDEIGNFVMREATRPTNLLFALPGAGWGAGAAARAASVGARMAPRAARIGAALGRTQSQKQALSRVGDVLARGAPRFAVGATEPFGTFGGKLPYRVGLEMAGGPLIAGAARAATEALPEDAHWGVKLGFGLGAGLLGGAALAKTGMFLPTRFPGLVSQASLGRMWLGRQLSNIDEIQQGKTALEKRSMENGVVEQYNEMMERVDQGNPQWKLDSRGQPTTIASGRTVEFELVSPTEHARNSGVRTDPGSGLFPYRVTRRGNIESIPLFTTPAAPQISDEISGLNEQLSRINADIEELQQEGRGFTEAIEGTFPEGITPGERLNRELEYWETQGVKHQFDIDMEEGEASNIVISPAAANRARRILAERGQSPEQIDEYLQSVADATHLDKLYAQQEVVALANKNLKRFRLTNTVGDEVNVWSETLGDIVEPTTKKQQRVRAEFDKIIEGNPDQFDPSSRPLRIIDARDSSLDWSGDEFTFIASGRESDTGTFRDLDNPVEGQRAEDLVGNYSEEADQIIHRSYSTEVGRRWRELPFGLEEDEGLDANLSRWFPMRLEAGSPGGGGAGGAGTRASAKWVPHPRYVAGSGQEASIFLKNPKLAPWRIEITGVGATEYVPQRIFKKEGIFNTNEWQDIRHKDGTLMKWGDTADRARIMQHTKAIRPAMQDKIQDALFDFRQVHRSYGSGPAAMAAATTETPGMMSDWFPDSATDHDIIRFINRSIQAATNKPPEAAREMGQISITTPDEQLRQALRIRSMSSQAERLLDAQKAARQEVIDSFNEFTGVEEAELARIDENIAALREEELDVLNRINERSDEFFEDTEITPEDMLIPPTLQEQLDADTSIYSWRDTNGEVSGGFKISNGIMSEFWVKDPEMVRLGEDEFYAQQEANDILIATGEISPGDTLPDDLYGVTGDALGGKALLKAIQDLDVKVIQVPSGPMSVLLQRLGFEEIARTSFRDANGISPTWNRGKYGSPDVITLAYTGGPRKGIIDGTGRIRGGLDSRLGATEFGETRATRNEIKDLGKAALAARRISELSDELYGSQGGKRLIRFADLYDDPGAAEELGRIAIEADPKIVELDEVDREIPLEEGIPVEDAVDISPAGTYAIEPPLFRSPDPDRVRSLAQATGMGRAVGKNAEEFIDYNIGKLRAEGTNLYDIVTFKTVKRGKGGKFESVPERYILDPDSGDLVPEKIWVELGKQLDGFGTQMGRRINTGARALAIERMRARMTRGVLENDPAVRNEILGNVLRGQFDPDAAEAALTFTEASTNILHRANFWQSEITRQLEEVGLINQNNPELGKIRPFTMTRFDGSEAVALGVNVKDGDQVTRRVQTPDGERIDAKIYKLEDIFNEEEMAVLVEVFGELRILRNAEVDQLDDAGISVTGEMLARSQEAQEQLGHYLPSEGMVNIFDLIENSNFTRTPDGMVELGQYVPRDVVFNPRVGSVPGRGVVDSTHQQRRQTRNGPGYNDNELQFNVEELLYNNASLDFQTDLPLLLTARYKAGLDKLNAQHLNDELKIVGKTAYEAIAESNPTLLRKHASITARLARLKDPRVQSREEGERKAVGQLAKQSDKVLDQMDTLFDRILRDRDQWKRYSAADMADIGRRIVASVNAQGATRQSLGKLLAERQALRGEARAQRRLLTGASERDQSAIFRQEQALTGEFDPYRQGRAPRDWWNIEELWEDDFYKRLDLGTRRIPEKSPGVPRQTQKFLLGLKAWEDLVGYNKALDELELEIIRQFEVLKREFASYGMPLTESLEQFDPRAVRQELAEGPPVDPEIVEWRRDHHIDDPLWDDPRLATEQSDAGEIQEIVADTEGIPISGYPGEFEVPEVNDKVLRTWVSLNQLYVRYLRKQKAAANELQRINDKIQERTLQIDSTARKNAPQRTAEEAETARLIKQANMMERNNAGLEVANSMLRYAKRLERADVGVNKYIKKYDEKVIARQQARINEMTALEEELKLLDDELNTLVSQFNGQLHLSDLSSLASTFQSSALRVPSNVARELARTPGLQPNQRVSGGLKLAADLNAEMRQVSATLDFSGTFIQGLFAMGAHPVEFAKAWSMVTKAVLGHPEHLLRVMEENSAYIGDMIDKGGVWMHPGGQEEMLLQAGTPALSAVGSVTNKTELGRLLSKTLAKGRDLSNLHFAQLGNMLRLLMYKKFMEGAGIHRLVKGTDLSPTEQRDVVKMINAATGYSTDYKPGTIAQSALFAPRFFVSQLKMLQAAAFRDDAAGQYARSLMLSTMMAGVTTTIALNSVRGEETDFAPVKFSSQGEPYFNSNFLKIRNVGGRDVSVFGPYDSLLALLVTGMAEGPESMFTRGMRQKASPMAGNLYDAITGTDFQGNKVTWNVLNDTSGTIATAARMAQNSYTPFYVSDVAEDVTGGRMGIGSPAILAGAFLGLKTAPLSVKERRDYELVEWVRSLPVEVKEEVGLIYTTDDGVKVDIEVEEWSDLTGEAKSLFSSQFPQHDQDRLDSLQRRSDAGDISATSQLNKEFIADTAFEEQQALADAFERWRNNEPDPVLGYVVPLDISKILSEIGNIRYRSWQAQQTQDEFFEREIKNPGEQDPGQVAMSQYWDALQSSSIPGTNEVIWPEFNRKIGALYNIWTPEQITYIENRSPAKIHPVFQPYWDARNRVNQSAYYVVADEIYNQENIQNAIAAIVGADNVPPYYELFTTMIEDLRADADPRRQQIGTLLGRLNNRLSPIITRRRQQVLQLQPSLREDLVLIGRIRPQGMSQTTQPAPLQGSMAAG